MPIAREKYQILDIAVSIHGTLYFNQCDFKFQHYQGNFTPR